MVTISYINYWNNNNIQDRWFTTFIKENIHESVQEVSPSKNPTILICSCFGNINKVKQTKALIKIFFYGENLERFPPYNHLNLLQETFDIIIGFNYTDKNNKLFRLPLWICYYPYYNLHDKSNNVITYLETEYQKKIHNKTEFCSLIARHDRGGQRTIILNEMKKYGNVLCPSNFNKNCNNIAQGNKAKIDFIKHTKYNICPENSTFEGYHTEKIFQAFEAGTIPIYWAIEEPEKEILNKNKYCFIKNINDTNEVKRKIKDAVEIPEKYLEGNIFNDTAYEVIGTYYDDLIEEIKRLLLF